MPEVALLPVPEIAREMHFKVPAVVEVRDELPRNPGGKVMKHLLQGR